MQSFTYGSAQAIHATVAAQHATGEKFDAEFNNTDFQTVLIALQQLGLADPAALASDLDIDVNEAAELVDNAGSLMSNMASVLDVEMI